MGRSLQCEQSVGEVKNLPVGPGAHPDLDQASKIKEALPKTRTALQRINVCMHTYLE